MEENNVLQIAKLFCATHLNASSRQPCKLQIIFPAFAKVKAEVLRGRVTHSVPLRFEGLQTEASVSDSTFHVFPYRTLEFLPKSHMFYVLLFSFHTRIKGSTSRTIWPQACSIRYKCLKEIKNEGHRWRVDSENPNMSVSLNLIFLWGNIRAIHW